MRERAPALVALILLVGLVIGTWWAADYAQRSIPIDPPRRITHEPDSWAKNFVMLRTDAQGVAINRIEGETMYHYPDDDSYEILRLRAIGQQPGSPITVGTSDTAILDQNGNRITMNGNAHLERQPSGENAALEVSSEQLIILPEQDVVYTDLPARVVNNKSVMNGTGMRYDNRTRQLQVYSSTDVKISGEDARPARTQPSGQPPEQP